MAVTAEADSARRESERYAWLLETGTRLGLLALVISFTVYVSGLLPAHVPLEQLPHVWKLPVHDYLQQTGIPNGWGWLSLIGSGDMANLIGIAVLASCSVPPLLGVVPLFIATRDRVYVGICLCIVLVLFLAASGVLTQGH